MGRLTRRTRAGDVWLVCGIDRAVKQLAAYEDTGFTPEQIEKLKKELYLTGTYVCKPKDTTE